MINDRHSTSYLIKYSAVKRPKDICNQCLIIHWFLTDFLKKVQGTLNFSSLVFIFCIYSYLALARSACSLSSEENTFFHRYSFILTEDKMIHHIALLQTSKYLMQITCFFLLFVLLCMFCHVLTVYENICLISVSGLLIFVLPEDVQRPSWEKKWCPLQWSFGYSSIPYHFLSLYKGWSTATDSYMDTEKNRY